MDQQQLQQQQEQPQPQQQQQQNGNKLAQTSSTTNTTSNNTDAVKQQSQPIISSSQPQVPSKLQQKQLQSEQDNEIIVQQRQPPEIPHITINIKPYSEIIDEVSKHAYHELLALIKTLPSSNDPTRFYGNAFEEDLQRKKNLLELVVKIRNYFVKLYVLNKWSVNSVNFGKLIDLLNWLRGQQMFFDSLVENIKRIKIDLNFAKLPNHDLITSFIVLNEAHYHNNNSYSNPEVYTDKNLSLLPSYNLLENQKLNAKFLLKVLKNLNSLLHLKISKLFLKCPPSSLNSIVFPNCVIRDGKLFLSINNEFDVCLTLVNLDSNEIKTDDEQQSKSNDEQSNTSKTANIFRKRSLENHVFIILDFKFKFGLDDLGNMVFNIDNYLPLYNQNNLKTFLNSQVLYQDPTEAVKYTKNPLVDLYDYLHTYSLNYKLYLISNQLSMLINGVAPAGSVGSLGNSNNNLNNNGNSSLNGANKLTWGSNLKYTYNPEKSLITIFYWIQKRHIKQKSYIQIGITNDYQEANEIGGGGGGAGGGGVEETAADIANDSGRGLNKNKRLSFKWFKDGKLSTDNEFEELFQKLESGFKLGSYASFTDGLLSVSGDDSDSGANTVASPLLKPISNSATFPGRNSTSNGLGRIEESGNKVLIAETASNNDNQGGVNNPNNNNNDDDDDNKEFVGEFQKFSIQTLLSLVLNRHVESLINDIHYRMTRIVSNARHSFGDVLELSENNYFKEDTVSISHNSYHQTTAATAQVSASKVEYLELVDKYYILIKLNNEKLVYYSIDYLTGHSFFINPSPSVNAICSKYQFHNFVVVSTGTRSDLNNSNSSGASATEWEIRTGPMFFMPSNFAELEESLVIAHQLLIVRMELLRHETIKVLSVTGWVNCPIINLELSELAKLQFRLKNMKKLRETQMDEKSKSDSSKLTAQQQKGQSKVTGSTSNGVYNTDASFIDVLKNYRNFWSLQYYQLRNWPSNWFLIVFLTNFGPKDGNNKLCWLAQIKSINGRWSIAFHDKLVLSKYRSLRSTSNADNDKDVANLASFEKERRAGRVTDSTDICNGQTRQTSQVATSDSNRNKACSFVSRNGATATSIMSDTTKNSSNLEKNSRVGENSTINDLGGFGNPGSTLDYDTSLMLGKSATNKISIHIVMEELNKNQVRTNVPENNNKFKIESMLNKIWFSGDECENNVENQTQDRRSGIIDNPNSNNNDKNHANVNNTISGTGTGEQLSIIILDNRSLVPAANIIKNNLVLTVELFNSKMKLNMYGQLTMPMKLLQDDAKNNNNNNVAKQSLIQVDTTGEYFKISSIVDINEHSFKEKKLNYFYQTYQCLQKFANLVSLVNIFAWGLRNESRHYSEFLDVYLDRIVFKYGGGDDDGSAEYYIFQIKSVDDGDNGDSIDDSNAIKQENEVPSTLTPSSSTSKMKARITEKQQQQKYKLKLELPRGNAHEFTIAHLENVLHSGSESHKSNWSLANIFNNDINGENGVIGNGTVSAVNGNGSINGNGKVEMKPPQNKNIRQKLTQTVPHSRLKQKIGQQQQEQHQQQQQQQQNLLNEKTSALRKTIANETQDNLRAGLNNSNSLDILKYQDGILKLLKYIKLTSPLVNAFKKFQLLNKRFIQNLSSQSSLEKVRVVIKYHCTCHDLLNYAVIYDIRKEATRRPEQNSNTMQHIISRSLIKVAIKMKNVQNKPSLMVQMLPMTIENQLNGTMRMPSAQQYRALAQGLRKLLAESAVLLAKKGEVHFLGDCMSCDTEMLFEAIQSLHERIMKKFR